MKTSNTVDILNDLIQICKDGQAGFRDASENVRDAQLTTLFGQYSLQRSKFAGELQQHVTRLGEDAEQHSSVASAMHRGWIDLKSAFTKGSDHAVLAECERGEDHAVAAYKDALEQELPADIRSDVEEQYASVQAAHNEIRDRRDASVE